MLTTAIYSMGLSGAYLFDDYPNIVDNPSVQPHDASVSSLVRAALSSPASEFKRPLASLSFAANYLASGLDPYWMKLTNLVIHLLNGLLVFLLSQALIQVAVRKKAHSVVGASSGTEMPHDAGARTVGIIAALVAAGWMLLPINLTGVLYVVQRMESMANLFVLLGLIGYVAGRRRMLGMPVTLRSTPSLAPRRDLGWGSFSSSSQGFIFCLVSITIPAAVGILAKETAVMLPLYALLTEWILFGFQLPQDTATATASEAPPARRRDRRIIALFLLVLALPLVLGLAWLLPGIFNSEVWATRDFTLATRLFSESRIIVDYIVWTLLPTPAALSFYHDNFHISIGLLTPWTTLASIVFLGALIALTIWLRRRYPLAALGIALFLGSQLLTGTILPLELIYEHRNYFSSFGLLLAIIPLLAAPSRPTVGVASSAAAFPQSTEAVEQAPALWVATEAVLTDGTLPMALPRYVLLAGLMLCWTASTALTAHSWGNPLRLAEDLASRAPQSPRAQYELGRTYIINSHYDPTSPFTQLAYAPLERSAALPDASILPEQALIFMNSRMHLPLKDAWWTSMIAKLKARKPGVQDESSLVALTQCNREQHCDLPRDRMIDAFHAAILHPNPSARLFATYGDYAWNVLDDKNLGEQMFQQAIKGAPNEPAYQVTLVRMLVAQNRIADARTALERLQTLNIGGRLNETLTELHDLPGLR
ncbi:hypothetical protein GCM10008098_03780 [Rhodanobacter panaciterrae]|uniref:Tetratricopeptide repeat protein n=1 Tax=Rhodanobacter panaciterrae TaxID=490572 RepID=A0ABQ2ZK28_9GAMM|nr:hypothetical protein GCM10008098_03780 [Rhodanobacter panaciterrae]